MQCKAVLPDVTYFARIFLKFLSNLPTVRHSVYYKNIRADLLSHLTYIVIYFQTFFTLTLRKNCEIVSINCPTTYQA